MGPADSHRISRVPRYSGGSSVYKHVSNTGLSPSMVDLSMSFFYTCIVHYCYSYNPVDAETSAVWATPRSLATTKGITFVFFS